MRHETIQTDLKEHQDHIIKGVIFGLLAFASFGVMQVTAKLLSEHHHVIEIAFYRNLIVLVPLTVFLLARKDPSVFKTKKPRAVMFRSVLGAISLIITFAAFSYLPMSDTTVLLFVSSLLTPALSFFILKEHVGWHRWAAIFFGMCGVLFLAQPSGDVHFMGVCFALLAALTHSIMYTTLRYLKTENPLPVTFYFILMGTLLPGVMMPFFWTPIDPAQLWLFLGVGLSGGAAQLFLANAYKYAPASIVAPLNYTGLLWATGFDILIWHYVPGWPVFTGAFIIIASNFYILHRERLKKGKTDT